MELPDPSPTPWQQPPAGAAEGVTNAETDAAIVAAVVAGDETAFLYLVERWSPILTALASRVGGGRAPTEALLTGAWRRGLDAFRGYRDPPGLRVLLVRALLDEARVAGVLLAPAAAYQPMGVGPTVDAERFRHPDDPEWPGHWARPPTSWPDVTEVDRVDVAPAIDAALDTLTEPQRLVVALVDCGGCQIEDVSRIIGVSPGQVRDLLHRARAAVRTALEDRLAAAS